MTENNTKAKILVVDDEEKVLELLKKILSDRYLVFSAINGEEALKQLDKEEIDIILLDIMMPKQNGIELLRCIRKKYEDSIDVIMVSVSAVIKDVVEAIKLGAYHYITKPFEIVELLSVIEEVVEKRNLKKEISQLRSEMRKFRIKNIHNENHHN